MGTTKEGDQPIPEEIEDQAILNELFSLGQTIRTPRYNDFRKVDWDAVKAAREAIPGKVLKALEIRLQTPSRLAGLNIYPNDLASQLGLSIPYQGLADKPPMPISVEYSELEAINPDYGTLIEPYISPPKP